LLVNFQFSEIPQHARDGVRNYEVGKVTRARGKAEEEAAAIKDGFKNFHHVPIPPEEP